MLSSLDGDTSSFLGDEASLIAYLLDDSLSSTAYNMPGIAANLIRVYCVMLSMLGLL